MTPDEKEQVVQCGDLIRLLDEPGLQAGRRHRKHNESARLCTRHFGAHQCALADVIHTVHGENLLCQIDANGYDGRDSPQVS